MNEVSNQNNIGAHYSNEQKVKLKKIVATPPSSVPKTVLYSDQEANIKLKNLTKDVYESAKAEKKKGFSFPKLF